ncbi:MAG: CoA-binding protein, partial [Phycisphaerae bacterium]
DGWDVYPINPKGGEIEGLQAYTSIADLPTKPDRVSMYLPPAVGVKVLPEIAAVSPEEFYLNPGTESDELVAAARESGIEPILACSIVEIGVSPADFPD